MMTPWKSLFTNAISSFRAEQYEQALAQFTEIISLDIQDASVFDSRAAVYERLGKKKEALLDSKQVIYLAPGQWKGYARSARLFYSARKYDSALKMIDMAIERVRPEDEKRLAEFTKLRESIIVARDADLEHQRQKARKTFYHFGKLPLEIATSIFALVIEETPAYAVVLAQICREWRTVVLDTPFLWRTLVLTTKNPARKAKVWKERCQGQLWRLDIRDGDMKIIWALNEFHSMSLHSLRQLALRGVRVDHFFKMLPACTPAVLRNLDSLELDDLILQRDVLFFTEQPDMQLRTLIVRGTRVHWPNLADSCRKLRTLSYEGTFELLNLQDLLCLLHSNQELETLQLSFQGSWPNHSLVKPPASEHELPDQIVLPTLTKLGLACGRDLPPTQILSTLSFPSLRTLHLSKLTIPADDVLEQLLDSGSARGITEFKIDSCMTRSHDALLRLLDSALELQILRIARHHEVNPLLEALTSPVPPFGQEQGQLRCPNLSHLEVTHCPDIKSGPIVRLVKLRNGSGTQGNDVSRASKINTLILDGCQIDPEVLPWLRQQVPVMSSVYQTRKEAKAWRK